MEFSRHLRKPRKRNGAAFFRRWCGHGDLNPDGLPREPKSRMSANSIMPAQHVYYSMNSPCCNSIFAMPFAAGHIHASVGQKNDALCFQHGSLGAWAIVVKHSLRIAESVYDPMAGDCVILAAGKRGSDGTGGSRRGQEKSKDPV